MQSSKSSKRREIRKRNGKTETEIEKEEDYFIKWRNRGSSGTKQFKKEKKKEE